MKNVLLVLAISLCWSLSAFAQKALVSEEKPCPEEYLVYSAVLKQRLASQATGPIVVRKFTGGSSMKNSLISNQIKTAFFNYGDLVEEELIENYNANHSRPAELENKFCVGLPVVLATDEDLKPIFEGAKEDTSLDAMREALLQKYGSGRLIKFSRVAFNQSKSAALVHAEASSGGVDGTGDIYFLSKKEGKWAVIRTFNTWIS